MVCYFNQNLNNTLVKDFSINIIFFQILYVFYRIGSFALKTNLFQ